MQKYHLSAGFPISQYVKIQGFAQVDPSLFATSPHVPLYPGTELKVIVRTCVLSSALRS